MSRKGLLRRDTTFQDVQLERSFRSVSDAVDALSTADDLLSAPIYAPLVSGAIPSGKTFIVFAGKASQTLTLPQAKALGGGAASVVVFINNSANAVTIAAVSTDTIQGATSFSLPAATAAVLTSDSVSKWFYRLLSGAEPSNAGRLLRAPQVLTAGTTVNHPAGTATIVVEVIGGGGGGGGAVNSAAAQVTLGAGGGGGAYAEKAYVASATSSTYTIGAAGTAGANTGAAAGNGGSTTFTHNGVTVTSPGGNGAPANTGSGMAGVTGTAFAASGPGTGAAVATTGDLNEGGTDGGWGVRFGGTTGQSGGGAGVYGGGGAGRTTQGSGNAATGPGAGGAGGLSTNAGGAVTGGAGGGGVIVVREYS